MPAPKSSRSSKRPRGSRPKKGSRSSGPPANANAAAGQAEPAETEVSSTGASAPDATSDQEASENMVDQLTNRVIKSLDLVMLTRERIQETLDEAAERGRVTRTDANDLVTELVRRGRQQTDELMSDIERLLGRGRDQIGSAAKRARLTTPVDRLVRTGERSREDDEPSPPIDGYDEMTATKVQQRLGSLSHAELRGVRDYELRHANRKSVLAAIDKALA